MWEHLYRLVETLSDWEFDEVVRKEIAEFSTLRGEVSVAFNVLIVGAFIGAWTDFCPTVSAERSMSEKRLEALGISFSTPKQVCERFHPLLGSYSKERRRRAMKSVSMTLLRLADSSRHLV